MVQSLNCLDVVVRQVQRFQIHTLVQSFYFYYLVFIQPDGFQFGAVGEALNESVGTSMAAMPQFMRVSILSPLKRLRMPMEPKSSRTSSMTSILSISFQTLSLKPFMRFWIEGRVR